jgi:hypothetical protein
MMSGVLRCSALAALAALVVSGAGAAQPSADLDTYAVFATASLRASALRVLAGNVGVDRGPLTIHGALDAADAVVAADVVRLGGPARCAALFAATAATGDGAGCGPAQGFSLPIVADVAAACGFPAAVPACAPGRPVVVPRRGVRRLAPGTYGDVTVAGGPGMPGRLLLAGGDYVFCSVRLGRDAVLEADSAVQAFVTGDVLLGTGALARPAAGRDVRDLELLAGYGRVTVARRALLAGVVCAPDALVRLADAARLEGRFVGGEIRAGRITASGLLPPKNTTTTTTSTTTTTTTTTSTTTTSTTVTTTTTSTTTSTTTTTTTVTTSTTLAGVVCPRSGILSATVTLVPAADGSTASPVAGFKVNLAYPMGVSLPGSGVLPVNDPTDPATRELLLDLALYDGLVVFFDTDTMLVTTVAAAAGRPVTLSGPYAFEEARFDCTPGAVVVPAAFACAVVDESDPLGQVIPPNERPSCRVTVSP